jgi:putative phosphoribosyl transferase
VVACIPPGGITVGVTLARELNLPLELVSCGVIVDPVHPHQTIGSVGMEEVSFSTYDHGIPQDYIWRQIGQVRHELNQQQEFFAFRDEEESLANQQVILVSDAIDTADRVAAALYTLRRRNPIKLILAAPVIAGRALHVLSRLADDIVMLNKTSDERIDKWFEAADDRYLLELLQGYREYMGIPG